MYIPIKDEIKSVDEYEAGFEFNYPEDRQLAARLEECNVSIFLDSIDDEFIFGEGAQELDCY